MCWFDIWGECTLAYTTCTLVYSRLYGANAGPIEGLRIWLIADPFKESAYKPKRTLDIDQLPAARANRSQVPSAGCQTVA